MNEVWYDGGLADTQMSLAIDSNQWVGSTPVYRIAGAPPNQPIIWTSVHNGQATGENNTYPGHFTTADGDFTVSGGAWPAEHIGNWTKTAIVGGKSASVSFNVQPAPSSSTPNTGSGSGSTNTTNTTSTTSNQSTDDAWTWIKDNALYIGLGAAALLILPSVFANFGAPKRGR